VQLLSATPPLPCQQSPSNLKNNLTNNVSHDVGNNVAIYVETNLDYNVTTNIKPKDGTSYVPGLSRASFSSMADTIQA
jgi:hypothetical protein